MAGWFNVAPETELTPGKSKLIDVDNVMVAVFNIDGEFYAIENICTHDGSPLLDCDLETENALVGTQVVCPRHGARFCVKTGEALSPPAYEATTVFPVRVKDGIVQVTDPRWD